MQACRRVIGVGAAIVLAGGALLGFASGPATAAPVPATAGCGYHETDAGNKQTGKGWYNNCEDHAVQVEMIGIGNAKVCAKAHEDKLLGNLYTSNGTRDITGARKSWDSCPG